MKQIYEMMEKKESFWVGFTKKRDCKRFLIFIKNLGYKWFTGQEIVNEDLDFYFTLEVNPINLTIGMVPNFQRFSKFEKDKKSIVNF